MDDLVGLLLFGSGRSVSDEPQDQFTPEQRVYTTRIHITLVPERRIRDHRSFLLCLFTPLEQLSK